MAHDISIATDTEILAPKSESIYDYAELDKLGLTNPDEPKEHVYDWPDEFLDRIIGAMLHDDYFLKEGAKLIKPGYFRMDAHRLICSIIFGFLARHGAAPDLTMLRAEVSQSRADHPNKEFYLAEVEAVWESYVPGVEKRAYFLDQITEFAKTQAMRCAFHKALDCFHSTRPDRWDKVWAAIDDARNVGRSDDLGQEYWSLGELDQDIPAIRHLIQDHMIVGGLTYLNADSGIGKTFLALDWSLCIASGKPYLGEYKVSQGPVYYVGQEGADDNKLRVKGWLTKHAQWLEHQGLQAGDVPFNYVPRDFDLRSSSDTRELLRLIRDTSGKEKPKAVVLDTVFNMLGGGNDNDASDMGKFIGSCKSIIKETGAAVICISHPGHENKHRMRGHSCQWPACDSIVLAEGSVRTGITISFSKQKSFAPMESYKVFASQCGPVAKDQNEHEVFTLVCHGKEDQWAFRRAQLNEGTRSLFLRLVKEYGNDPWSWEKARATLDLPKSSFSRQIKLLADLEFLHQKEGSIWSVNPAANPETAMYGTAA